MSVWCYMYSAHVECEYHVVSPESPYWAWLGNVFTWQWLYPICNHQEISGGVCLSCCLGWRWFGGYRKWTPDAVHLLSLVWVNASTLALLSYPSVALPVCPDALCWRFLDYMLVRTSLSLSLLSLRFGCFRTESSSLVYIPIYQVFALASYFIVSQLRPLTLSTRQGIIRHMLHLSCGNHSSDIYQR